MNDPIRVLLLDDDGFWRGKVREVLQAAFPSLALKFTEMESEADFEAAQAATPPEFDLVVIDQLFPSSNKNADKAAADAGIRCYQALRANQGTKHIPVVFYTILDTARLPNGVPSVRKTGSVTEPQLTDAVRIALGLTQ
jgi:CheY-like chemotaxis protein